MFEHGELQSRLHIGFGILIFMFLFFAVEINPDPQNLFLNELKIREMFFDWHIALRHIIFQAGAKNL